jgi:hypothetical protein
MMQFSFTFSFLSSVPPFCISPPGAVFFVSYMVNRFTIKFLFRTETCQAV